MKSTERTAIWAILLGFIVAQLWAPVSAWAFKEPASSSVTVTAATGLSGSGTVASPLAGVTASGSVAGYMSTGTQTIAGAKTFSGNAVFSGDIQTQTIKANSTAGSPVAIGMGNGAYFCMRGTDANSGACLRSSGSTDWIVSYGGANVWNFGNAALEPRNAALTMGTSTYPFPSFWGTTTVRGTITMSSGTGTAIVAAGAFCVCSDTAATPVIVRCAVSSTTLTASEVSGTSSHAVAYICMN